MLTSSRDNWERLVSAVVKKQQIWELCHQHSRTPSICSTVSSDDSTQRNLSFSGSNSERFSVPASPLRPSKSSQVNIAAVNKNASSRSIKRMLFSGWYRTREPKYQDIVDNIPPEYREVFLGQVERFSFHQLQVATDMFSYENMVGFGVFRGVYKGRLIDGTLVAVKRYNMELTTLVEHDHFQTEVQIFTYMPKHNNLLRLRGFCMTSNERFLVYPYMVNGSLASCLRERLPNVAPLDWGTRKRIALGIARGLSYLHNKCDVKIIHCDVKAANILLDEEYEAVIGDFGLAILMDHYDTDVTISPRGTLGHIAPEHMSTGKLSEKTDVFAYGVTLLELITGQWKFDLAPLANNGDLIYWAKRLLKEKKLETLVDRDLHGNYVDQEVEDLIKVALICTQDSPFVRPNMSDMVRLLKGDGLAEKWNEFVLAFHPIFKWDPITEWIISEKLDGVELAGPR